MIFHSLTKALEELESIIKKIRDLHDPPNSRPGEIWEWVSSAYKQIEIGGEPEEELKRIKEHVREAQKISEKIESEYRAVRLSIELALIASYLRLLFPFSRFLASLVKRGRDEIRGIRADGKIWHDHLELLEDEITKEKECFASKYL
jgi:hypothetical protein